MEQVFSVGDEDGLVNLLHQTGHIDIEEHARTESERVHHFRDAASKIMLPTARILGQEEALSPSGLRETFERAALAYRAIIFNKPIICSESLLFRENMKISEKLSEKLSEHMSGRDWEIRVIYPPIGTYRNKMFGLAQFGFLNAVRLNSQNLKIPYIALPDDFVDYLETAGKDGEKLIEAFIALSDLINHDWLHCSLIAIVHPNNSHLADSSPIAKFRRDGEHDVFKDAFQHNVLRLASLANFYDNVGGESVHLRFQAELLQEMIKTDNNPLSIAINNYLDAWKTFVKRNSAHTNMSDPDMSPAEFATRLLSFNLVRALPLNHKVVQDILDDPAFYDYQEAFKDGYNAKMVGVTFGGGSYKPKREDPFSIQRLNARFNQRDQKLFEQIKKERSMIPLKANVKRLRRKFTQKGTVQLPPHVYREAVTSTIANSLALVHNDVTRALKHSGHTLN